MTIKSDLKILLWRKNICIINKTQGRPPLLEDVKKTDKIIDDLYIDLNKMKKNFYYGIKTLKLNEYRQISNILYCFIPSCPLIYDIMKFNDNKHIIKNYNHFYKIRNKLINI
jgi:hypothetical protein